RFATIRKVTSKFAQLTTKLYQNNALAMPERYFFVEKRYKHCYTLSQFVCLLDVPPVRHRGTSLIASRLPVLLTLFCVL
ncbi:MAG: hypothetical protein Q4F22_06425, partial [Phascolarctobacterium sp.]|nr:hypothetical protein [Phascolarctobacterium sp.]